MKSNKNIVLIITNNCQLSIIHYQFRKWSAFPVQTPYHYAYNSPLTYRDPSGLAPEKEKEREELMGIPSYEDLVKSSYFHYNISSESKYDAGGVSYYAREPEGGSRKGGSNSSAKNGQGGNESDDNDSGGGFWSSLWKNITGIFSSDDESDGEGVSGWVWNGVDYGSKEALVAATSLVWQGNSARNDRKMTPEVLVEADRIQVLPEANWWDFVVEGFTWDSRTVNIGGKEYLVDRNGYAYGMPAFYKGTPPDVGIGVVGKIDKTKKAVDLIKGNLKRS